MSRLIAAFVPAGSAARAAQTAVPPEALEPIEAARVAAVSVIVGGQ